MKKTRVGIIGAGGIAAKLHLPELAEQGSRCEVALVSGRRESRLRLLQKNFDVGGYTTNYEDVIADASIDAVIIATPHPQHVSWGIAALQAGKHVLMQKPLCGDMKEADAFVAAAEKSDRTVMVLPHIGDAMFAVRRGIGAETIGRVAGARARTSHGGPEVYYREVRAIFEEGDEPGSVESEDDLWFFDAKRAGVGALFDMGIYAVAHLVALLGSVKSVSAVIGTFDKPTELEDNAALILQMENGAIAVAETSWCDGARTWELSVHGTRGKYIVPGCDGAAATLFTPLSYDSDHAPIKDEPVTIEAADMVGTAHAHFLDCIERQTQPPASHAWAARHVTEVLLAGLEAGRSGCAVAISSRAEV